MRSVGSRYWGKWSSLALGAFVASITPGRVDAVEVVSMRNLLQIPIQGQGSYAHGHAFAGSRVAPLSDLRDGEWSRAAPDGSGFQRAVGTLRAEIGAYWNGLSVGLFRREDWRANASRDALDVFLASERGVSLEPGRRYLIDYRLTGFSADGVTASFGASVPVDRGWRLMAGGGFNVMRGRDFRRESWQGQLRDDGVGAMALTLAMEKASTHTDVVAENFWPSFWGRTPEGRGYGMDAGLRLYRDDGAYLEWVANDVAARMRWHDVPYETLAGTVTIATNDSPIEEAQLLQGRKVLVEVTDRLHAKQRVRLHLPVREGAVEVSDTYWAGIHFPQVAMTFPAGPHWSVKATYESRLESVGVGLFGKYLYLSVASDRGRFKDAKAVGVALGITVPLD